MKKYIFLISKITFYLALRKSFLIVSSSTFISFSLAVKLKKTFLAFCVTREMVTNN